MMENNTRLFQLNITCRSCKNGAHESCVKLQKQDFVTIKCSCSCHDKKNDVACGFERPDFATSVKQSLGDTKGNV